MNEVIETILNHRSVRGFEERTLTREQIETIIAGAQAASTSSFLQAYSIIGITDADKKRQLADTAGNQTYVAENGHFFVFCADLHRLHVAGVMENRETASSIESKEQFMVALIDASLAAQNAAITAESMGLGICYIGGIRNDLKAVKSILKTPDHVIPLFGMAVGYPAQHNDKKPRLPLNHVFMENEYQQNEEKFREQLEEYNRTISSYYSERTEGKRNDTWTGQTANMLERKTRMYMQQFVWDQKMDLR
ncbi:oxygen-insensitive NADPH nitroreductase [Mesobacillus zeae]|uniref:oxygen-insensitive NADPH nitroreductase n=1 Tax=Mesobacillus zeae TaxID=1917180 RepID=UPI0030082B10